MPLCLGNIGDIQLKIGDVPGFIPGDIEASGAFIIDQALRKIT
jgi:hypothetical protein